MVVKPKRSVIIQQTNLYNPSYGWRGLKRFPPTRVRTDTRSLKGDAVALESILFADSNRPELNNDLIAEMTSGDSSRPVKIVPNKYYRYQERNLGWPSP